MMGIGTINDKSLREEFLDEEFSIRNTSTQGFHRWTTARPNTTVKRDSRNDHNIETELLKVSQGAFKDGSFGNNAVTYTDLRDDLILPSIQHDSTIMLSPWCQR